MKKMYFIILILIVLSCKKNDIGVDNGCTILVSNNADIQLVSDSVLNRITYLLNKNRIDYTDLQFYSYITNGNTYIACHQYVNNLKIFTDYLIFDFNKHDSLVYSNDSDRVTNLNFTNIPKLSSSRVRYIFRKEFEKDPWYGNSNLIDSCVDLEFGYYDLNASISYKPKDFTTAWRVTLHNRDFPFAYINDLIGDLIYLWNGIIN